MAEQKLTSIEIGRAALRIAVTENRAEEQRIKEQLAAKGIRSTAVAAQRQGIVTETHVGAGAVAGAAHAALEQLVTKAAGFNVGGKIGIARSGEHLCVAIYMAVGVLNLDELCVALGHRSLASEE